jgi:hypothetical protein
MTIEISATEPTAAGSLFGLKPAVILGGAKAFTLAHPLGVLGFVGTSLILLGLYDAVREYRENKRAAADSAAAPDQPENTW